MADGETITPRMLSMEVDPDDAVESEYRVQAGTQVKYLIIVPGTLEQDLLCFPLGSLPPLPYEDQSWNTARLFRDTQSGEIKAELSSRKLAAVSKIWHAASYDVLALKRTKRLTAAAFEATLPIEARGTDSTNARLQQPLSSNVQVVAKIARFEWEISRIEKETRAYQLLHQMQVRDLAPRFLGHVYEGNRVIGFLLQKLQGRRPASIDDLGVCEAVLKKFHALGLLHGDVNRHNFLVGEDDTGVIDFEHTVEGAAPALQSQELYSLPSALSEESGRGGGFRSVS